MFAGKTAMSKAMMHHAAMRLVKGNNKSRANATSQIPLRSISKWGAGSHGGIMVL